MLARGVSSCSPPDVSEVAPYSQSQGSSVCHKHIFSSGRQTISGLSLHVECVSFSESIALQGGQETKGLRF